MSHNEYQNQMDYDAQQKKEVEEEMKSIDWVKRNEKIIDFTIDRSNEPDTEPESDTDTEEDTDFCCEDNYGEPGCKDGCSGGCCISCCGMGEEEEEKVNGCEVDRCDATGKCNLDKCFYEKE